MNFLSRQFFSVGNDSQFVAVRILSEESNCSWEEVSRLAYDVPRGWYELSRIQPKDRVEFTRDFWLDRIPYHPSAHPLIFEFFERLDDVAVVLVQRVREEPMDVELVYSLKDNGSFFRGKPPVNDEEILEFTESFSVSLPRDYLSFFRIHNGFGKLSEMGLLETFEVIDAKRELLNTILKSQKRIKSGEKEVDPGSLIPFYEAIGLSSFQCFYKDWYPGSEMGNVYFSGIDDTVSNLQDKRAWQENLAFISFSEWLSCYLQGMNLCT